MEGLDKKELSEQIIDVKDTTEIKELNVGETLDVKGGRFMPAPDFVELAALGFSEGELSTILRMRQRFEAGDSEFTPEHKRLRFARWLYQNGKIS
jgi:hypothetical protein